MAARPAVPALPVDVQGLSARDAPAMLLVHGWPDDERLFASQAAHFAGRYRVGCVRLPWFSTRATAAADAKARRYDPWGYGFEAMVEGVAQAARALGAGKRGRKIVLVGHDWGASTFFKVAFSSRGCWFCEEFPTDWACDDFFFLWDSHRFPD